MCTQWKPREGPVDPPGRRGGAAVACCESLLGTGRGGEGGDPGLILEQTDGVGNNTSVYIFFYNFAET